MYLHNNVVVSNSVNQLHHADKITDLRIANRQSVVL